VHLVVSCYKDISRCTVNKTSNKEHKNLHLVGIYMIIKTQVYCRVRSRPIPSLYTVLIPVNPGHILISCSFETRVLLSFRQYLGF